MNQLMEILRVRNLCIRYKGMEKDAVSNFSFNLCAGEVLSLRGPSGAGKSTIVYAIAGMLDDYDAICTGGSVCYKGRDLLAGDENDFKKIRWHEIALVPQVSMSSFNPVFSIGRTFEEMLTCDPEMCVWDKLQKRKKIKQLIDMVKLDAHVLDCFPHQLSGGMKQRAAIALALIFSPQILILDEATTGLDALVQADVLGNILELKKQADMSILFISHDIDLAEHFCHRWVEI